ncbi:MAG: tRNA 2-thiouridine(34) synthase MnmA [Cypionkella sp.]|nr:tRNA 2-thiouridine(34) synthase MnmA [Cypionkella sp.]
MLDHPLNSLGLPKPPSATRVVVAMSGGVDSSVVAAMLAEEGYDVVGVTLQLYDHGAALAKKGACCAGRDIHDAARVAETMGFPHYVLDYENTFREAVIEEFADAYLAGATPVPCIRCNERVKFKDLLATAKDLDADCMATGHYIQRKIGAAGPELHAAADAARDQSYFLFSTTPEQLAYLRFPLGHLASKAETRALAAKYGLPVADKPDSQDICFVHVLRLDPETRRVIVGPKEALATRTIPVREINWLGDSPFASRPEWHLNVKVRSTRPPAPAIIRPLSETEAEVELLSPEDGVSAGQACVFYAPEGSRIYGGGWIWRGR